MKMFLTAFEIISALKVQETRKEWYECFMSFHNECISGGVSREEWAAVREWVKIARIPA